MLGENRVKGTFGVEKDGLQRTDRGNDAFVVDWVKTFDKRNIRFAKAGHVANVELTSGACQLKPSIETAHSCKNPPRTSSLAIFVRSWREMP